MCSSPGFESSPTNSAPCSDSLSLRLHLCGLSLLGGTKSPAHASIGTPPPTYGAVTACKSTGSGSLSLPFRGSFHRSLTVLCAIGHWEYVALRGGPRGFSHRSTNNDLLRNPSCQAWFHLRDVRPLWCCRSNSFGYQSWIIWTGPTTPRGCTSRFGLIRFRSPLLTESMSLSFPPGTEMFQFPGFPSLAGYLV